MNLDNTRIGIIGLGYVGLPLAVEFGKRYPTIGFDLKVARIEELRAGRDSTRETTPEELLSASHLSFTADPADLADCNVYIVTVPTPIDRYKRPDLSPLEGASKTVGRLLKPGNVVIYESTVYPGCTEEVCVPILERESGLRYATTARSAAEKGISGDAPDTDNPTPSPMTREGRGEGGQHRFFVGYSPERINPGDQEHRLTTITKVTAGSTPEAADRVDRLYASIITAGTHKASSIKVAEAAKVIENTQRDLNIALMNELSLIFHQLGIDTLEVLQAAGTKWNFLPFRPGLVGGHCIGVDPYYLTYKAQEVGYHPEVILAGRRINDNMAEHVADETVKLMLKKGISVLNSRILVLGLTFKENCPDLRNTKVVDIIKHLSAYQTQVDVYDPWIDVQEAQHEYGLSCLPQAPAPARYHAILLAVGHRQFVALGADGIKALGLPNAVIYDVKSILPGGSADGRL